MSQSGAAWKRAAFDFSEKDMLDKKGFDLWADGYDRDVGLSDEENTYPFAGYRAVLGRIYETVLRREHPSVLDLGFGTGVLTARLYDAGCEVFGQDFSGRMLRLAQAKMPKAALFQGDFTQGLAEPLAARSYDFILSTYALHHLTDQEKPGLLRKLLSLLKEGGELLVGDVAFETRADLERCRAAAGEDWDGEEYYFVAEELRQIFPDLAFEKVSDCAGILRWRR